MVTNVYIGDSAGSIGSGSLSNISSPRLFTVANSGSNSGKKKSRRSNSKSTHNKSKSRGRKLKFGSPAFRKRYLGKSRHQKQPHTAGKRKDTSHRRIRFTSKNQPYIILANGKARFISKKSVSMSRKRKGGKY